MAKEGLDIPKLDTLIMCTPMSDVVQPIGRILRVHDSKKEPVVVDIIDSLVKICSLMYNTRQRLYLSKGWA
jgi:superfamily II DNA or RNA helicase